VTIDRIVQVRAAEIGEGYRIVQPDGSATAPVTWVGWDGEADSPARAHVRLDDGDVLDLPGDTVVSAVWHADAHDIPLWRSEVVDGASDPTAALLRDVVAAHPGDQQVPMLAARISRGWSRKPGLDAVQRLAAALYMRLDDAEHAIAVCALLEGERFDGDLDRWTPIRGVLGLGHHLSVLAGDEAAAAVYRTRLRETIESGRRPRWVDDPMLDTRNLDAAIERGDRRAEITWLALNISNLMKVRAAGLCRTLSDEQLRTMIDERIAQLRRAAEHERSGQ
jgi:hypothetical protein